MRSVIEVLKALSGVLQRTILYTTIHLWHNTELLKSSERPKTSFFGNMKLQR